MRLQCCPVAVSAGEFTFTERGMNFSVANAVNQGFVVTAFSAFAARHQMVFIAASAGL